MPVFLTCDGPPWGLAFNLLGPTSGSESLLLFFLHTPLTVKDFSGSSSPFNLATSDSARHIPCVQSNRVGGAVLWAGEHGGARVSPDLGPHLPRLPEGSSESQDSLGSCNSGVRPQPQHLQEPPGLHGHQLEFKI